MLFILEDQYNIRTPEDVDRVVCAELPDPSDELLFSTVTSHMLHGPCGAAYPEAPCMKNGSCSKKYPKSFYGHTQVDTNGYPVYRRRDNNDYTIRRGNYFNNRSVVPYNKFLCKKFDCHINVEICSSIKSVKYLYKYVYKGHDRIQARIEVTTGNPEEQNEPQQ